jgi:broad specificity phosphatase PhoE
MRHGHAFNQQLNVLAGDAAFPLTSRGLRQSSKIRERYGHILDGVSEILCSSVERCVQTIKPFHELNPHIELTITDELREINVGDAYVEDYNDVINEDGMRAFGYEKNERFKNGETLREVIIRVRSFLEKLNSGRDVLLVSHSGILNVVLHDHYGVGFDCFPFFNIHNCYPYVLERK